MKVLALDGALGAFSAACDDGGRIAARAAAGNDALEAGLALVAAVLDDAGVPLAALDRIAVGLGPGSFTGVRIAISYAKALAYAAGVPLSGISSYDVLTPDGAPLPLLTVVRGRPGIICARLRTAAGDAAACGAAADVYERLSGRLDARVPFVAGDAGELVAALGERGGRIEVLPPPAELPAVRIAALARSRSPAPSLHALVPDYGEVPAVSTPKGRS